MRTLRSWLCGFYAVIGAFMLLDVALGLHRQFGANPRAPHFSKILLINAVFAAASCLMLASAISYWKRWRAARLLGILVGGMNLGVPLVFVYLSWRYWHGTIFHGLTSSVLPIGLGVAGIWAFAQWRPTQESRAAEVEMESSRKGDGTSTWLNRAFVIGEYFLYFGIWIGVGTWGARKGLPSVTFWPALVQVIIVTIIAVTLHECGHALCGIALDNKIRAFIAGPFRWQYLMGRWRFSFNPMGLLATGGATAVVPQRLHEPKWKELCIIIAGPLANLLTGAIAVGFMLRAPGEMWKQYWWMVAMFAVISLTVSAVNLVPRRTDGSYTDGARIYQVLSGGSWYELSEVFRAAMATSVSALRPRDYDIDSIHRVIASGIATDIQEMVLHLFAHSYYLDRAQPQEAAREMQAAEAAYDKCAQHVPAELHSSFVVYEAAVRHDAARARLWWERMEAKKPTLLTADYWMAQSSLYWVEGKKEESQAAWNKAEAFLNRMPSVGTYAFDRDRLTELKQVTGTNAPTDISTQTPVPVV